MNKKYDGFCVAYYKKMWVAVPFFFIPEDTPVQSVDDESPVMKHIKIVASIVPWLMSEKEVKEICRKNGIPPEWVLGNFKTPNDKKDILSCSKPGKRKIKTIDKDEWKRILKNLNKINKRSSLICQILWFINNSIEGFGYITLEEVVRLRVDDVLPENSEGYGCIQLLRRKSTSISMTVHYLPKGLWKNLKNQISKTNSPFVFCNRDGGPILPIQVERDLKIAAKLSNIEKEVVTLSLRPGRANEPTCLRPVVQKEWTELNSIVCLNGKKKGKKSKYDPLNLLNAILYHLREQCPIRKIPSSFPSWSAVHSQYRRWKNNGIWEKIEKFLEKRG